MSLCSTRPGVKLGAGGLSSWAGSMEERRPGGREREWWGVQSLAESRAMARYRGRRREAVTRRSQAAHTARSARGEASSRLRDQERPIWGQEGSGGKMGGGGSRDGKKNLFYTSKV